MQNNISNNEVPQDNIFDLTVQNSFQSINLLGDISAQLRKNEDGKWSIQLLSKGDIRFILKYGIATDLTIDLTPAKIIDGERTLNVSCMFLSMGEAFNSTICMKGLDSESPTIEIQDTPAEN